MAGSLPPILVELKANAREFMTSMGAARGEVAKLGTESAGHVQKFAAIGKAALFGAAGAAAVVGVASVKMAADFQQSMTELVTGAGESQKNLKMVGDGVLKLARDTGESTQQLTQGLYMVESAGYHGAAGLNVLKAATQGAKVGGAEMGDVANAVTSALNAYSLKGTAATGVTNALVATVASGKLHMQDLATALGAVLPTAAALHVGIGELGGAISTMTAQGIDAHRATTSLRFLLSALAAPTGAAADKLLAMGISTEKLGDTLTHKGLTAALTLLTDHVGKKFPVGSAKYLQALSGMVGGTRGMQAVLALTGSHLETFKRNTEAVGAASHKTTGDVDGWAEVQKDFNTKLDRAKQSVETTAIMIGTHLIPVVEQAATVTADIVQWFEKHSEVAKILGVAIGSFLVVAIGAYIVSLTAAAVATIAATWPIIAIAAAIAALGVGIYELVKHWHAIWADISGFVRQHSLIIAAALAFLFGPIGLLAGAALELGTHWREVWDGIKSVTSTVAHGVTGAFSDIIGAGHDLVAWIVDKLLGAFGYIVHGAADAFGWVPGIGGKLKGAAKAFDDFRDSVNYALDGIHRNVMINVDAHLSAAANAALHASSPLTIGHAYAKGTSYAAGGLSLVGENGPELMDVPRGARIYPNGTGPGGGGVNVTISGPVYGADADELARKVRDAILRQQGRGSNPGFAA